MLYVKPNPSLSGRGINLNGIHGPEWNSWSPASAREVLAPIQQPIVNDLNAIERQTKPIQAAALEFFQSSVNSTYSTL
jgi:hypothetical protein